MRVAILLSIVCLVFAQVVMAQLSVPSGYQIRALFRPRNCLRAARPGDVIEFHYQAAIARGSPTGTPGPFDSTEDFKPISVVLLEKNMIMGLYQGLLGSCDREKRVLTIPASWGFGDVGLNEVPGKATVVYSVHVINVREGKDLFAMIDRDQNGCLTREEVTDWVKSERVNIAQVGNIVNRMFQHDDKNKDNVITCEELSGESKDCTQHIATCHDDGVWNNLDFSDIPAHDELPVEHSLDFDSAMSNAGIITETTIPM